MTYRTGSRGKTVAVGTGRLFLRRVHKQRQRQLHLYKQQGAAGWRVLKQLCGTERAIQDRRNLLSNPRSFTSRRTPSLEVRVLTGKASDFPSPWQSESPGQLFLPAEEVSSHGVIGYLRPASAPVTSLCETAPISSSSART